MIVVRQRILLLTVCLLFSVFSFSQTLQNTSAKQVQLKPISFPGIKGKIFDDRNRTQLPARIVITDANDSVYDSYYKALPGFFTEEDASFQDSLKPGSYTLTVFHSIDYESQKIPFTISSEGGVNAEIYLKPWTDLKKQGWVCGDGHDHLYTEIKPDTAMARTLRKICLAQGIDFVCAAQGWAGYNDTTWRAGYSKFSDNKFTLYYGSEMPKYRTGHTWWMGQESTRGYFWSTMDTVYENNYFQAPTGTTWNFKTLNFPFIPDVEVVQHYKTAEDAVAIIAHPTSWWWQSRGDVTKHVTNVAANLSFGLLSGKIWDGIVVMGYNHDHYNYQNLWFHVLNEGYRIPALSELDGGFERDDSKYYGSFRTYYQIDGKFSIDKVIDAVRKGRTFVTSGPIVFADVDNKYRIGDIVRTNGTKHDLHIKAYASGEQDDYLSYVIVFRNGEIFKTWDVRDKKSRTFEQTLSINENEKAWYIVKVYGKNAPKNLEDLDVMKVADKKLFPDFRGPQHDVAITSPFYFWANGVTDPKPLISKINLNVTPQQNKAALKNVVVEISVNGKKINTVHLKNGKGSFDMPVNGLLKISAEGYTPVYRSLYLDYPPHLALIEELATGNWLKKYDSAKYNPGEVPWEEFHFDKTKETLSNVDWNIEMTPNERDALWEKFEGLFAPSPKGE